MKSNIPPYKHFLPGPIWILISSFFKKKVKYKMSATFGAGPHLHCNETIFPSAALSGAFL